MTDRERALREALELEQLALIIAEAEARWYQDERQPIPTDFHRNSAQAIRVYVMQQLARAGEPQCTCPPVPIGQNRNAAYSLDSRCPVHGIRYAAPAPDASPKERA